MMCGWGEYLVTHKTAPKTGAAFTWSFFDLRDKSAIVWNMSRSKE